MAKKFASLKASTQLTWGKKPTRRPSTTAKDKAVTEVIKDPLAAPGLIQGIQAGSSIEWNVAIALGMLGWQFDYQVPIAGGRNVRGGQVIDFIVHTVPAWTVMAVNGTYWHRNPQMDEYKLEVAVSTLRRYGYNINNTPIVVWENSSLTVEAAYQYIYSKIGKN